MEAHAAANHYDLEGVTQGQTSDIVQGAVTSQHDMSFQGTHITLSGGCVVTVLPTPCTAADQHAGSPRRPPGRNGT